jgi:16S rRNA (guanine527-N7)-methyltransferase
MTSEEALLETLERARAAGFLGPGPVAPHLRHAEGFAVATEDGLGRHPRSFADLGTGGGVPGLALAVRWPQSQGILVEVGRRRAAGLRDAVVRLDLESRIEVVAQRAELMAHEDIRRERFEAVTARSFAPPAVTAEIASGLVQVGGVLIVSEPPDDDDGRWPVSGLHVLGFSPAEIVQVGNAHFAVVRKEGPVPAQFPRSVGRPGKRPLW